MLCKVPSIGRSFLVVSDEGSRSESMTDDELKTKMDQLKSCSADHELKKLSLAYLQFSTAPTRWRNSLKFFGNEDIVVAVIEPGIIPAANMNVPGRLPTRTVKPFYASLKRFIPRNWTKTNQNKLSRGRYHHLQRNDLDCCPLSICFSLVSSRTTFLCE